VTTGNFTGTSINPGFPYSSLVPFEEGVANLTNLSLDAVIDGSAVNKSATASNNVMCLSCHRAHASGFPHMTRWDISQTLLVDGTGNYSVSGGNTTTDVQKAMYDRAPTTAFVAYQRSLCNKCHAKD
jgi:predicted CXXCH cytochrome family protein